MISFLVSFKHNLMLYFLSFDFIGDCFYNEIGLCFNFFVTINFTIVVKLIVRMGDSYVYKDKIF